MTKLKVMGEIVLLESKRRVLPTASEKLKASFAAGDQTDYLLALKITKIGDNNIGSLTDSRKSIKIPKFQFNGQAISEESFVDYSVLPGMSPETHISLSYAVYFREGTHPDGNTLEDRVKKAKFWVGQKLELESAEDLEVVVSTKPDKDNKDTLINDVNGLTVNPGKITSQPAGIGPGRDTIINLVPNEAAQFILGAITLSVYGQSHITNSVGAAVPFHCTVAQSKLSAPITVIKDPATLPVNSVSYYSPSQFINEQAYFWRVVCHLIGKLLPGNCPRQLNDEETYDLRIILRKLGSMKRFTQKLRDNNYVDPEYFAEHLNSLERDIKNCAHDIKVAFKTQNVSDNDLQAIKDGHLKMMEKLKFLDSKIAEGVILLESGNVYPGLRYNWYYQRYTYTENNMPTTQTCDEYTMLVPGDRDRIPDGLLWGYSHHCWPKQIITPIVLPSNNSMVNTSKLS